MFVYTLVQLLRAGQNPNTHQWLIVVLDHIKPFFRIHFDVLILDSYVLRPVLVWEVCIIKLH